jgi:hypothetical protein
MQWRGGERDESEKEKEKWRKEMVSRVEECESVRVEERESVGDGMRE